jgi:hypothetical protein
MASDSANQPEFDFSSRGERLRLLSRCRLPNSRSKAVLQALDDAIGKDGSWCVSLARIVERTGLSRRTVQRAIDDLEELVLVEVSSRYSRTGEAVVRLPSRFRIVWSNLADFDPRAFIVEETADGPVEIERPRRGGAGGVSVAPGCGQDVRGVVSGSPGGGVSVAPGCGQGGTVPAQSPAQSRPNPPPASGKGDFLWSTFTDDELRASVRADVPELVERLFVEAVSAGWMDGGAVIRHRFFAQCHHVTGASGVRSLRGVLVGRLKVRDWSKGNQASDEWARAAVRACEAVEV